MVAYTASQELPYAEDGDRVCDVPALLQELAETVEARLGALEDSYDTLALRPAAKMVASQDTAFVPFSIIAFDQVEFDTAGLVDLNIDQQGLHLPPVVSPREVWLHGAFLVITGNAVNTDECGVAVSNMGGPTFWTNKFRDNIAFNSGHITIQFMLTEATVDPQLFAYHNPSLSGGVLGNLNMFRAEQFVVKVGELT